MTRVATARRGLRGIPFRGKAGASLAGTGAATSDPPRAVRCGAFDIAGRAALPRLRGGPSLIARREGHAEPSKRGRAVRETRARVVRRPVHARPPRHAVNWRQAFIGAKLPEPPQQGRPEKLVFVSSAGVPLRKVKTASRHGAERTTRRRSLPSPQTSPTRYQRWAPRHRPDMPQHRHGQERRTLHALRGFGNPAAMDRPARQTVVRGRNQGRKASHLDEHIDRPGARAQQRTSIRHSQRHSIES